MTSKWIAGVSALAGILFSVQVSSSGQQLCAGFLPPNNMKVPVGMYATGGISEAEFNQVMDRMEKIYNPEINAAGDRLDIKRLWSDSTVNASAQRQGNTVVLNMYGGLARHPATTVEGMALVVCHEMGHHMGGAPKTSDWFGSLSWATNEGGADYYATLKCLRRFFALDDNKAILATKQVDATAQASCMKQYSAEADQLLCLRTSLAGQSVAYLFQALTKETVVPSYATPDKSVVSMTNDAHPATQCRMDTYFAGMNCTVPVSSQLSNQDYRQGSCSTPRDTIGFRPLCWFKPN